MSLLGHFQGPSPAHCGLFVQGGDTTTQKKALGTRPGGIQILTLGLLAMMVFGFPFQSSLDQHVNGFGAGNDK